MICIIGPSYQEARNWAYGQQLSECEWFYPNELEELYRYSNFHVVVIDSAVNMPSGYFERIFSLAKRRGMVGRNDTR